MMVTIYDYDLTNWHRRDMGNSLESEHLHGISALNTHHRRAIK